jgi:N-acetylmuramoyl-L-alanine amidase
VWICGLLVAGCCFAFPDAARASTCKGPLRVAVDIGHSPKAPGAVSARGKLEYAFNRRFVEELVAAAKGNALLDLVVINPNGDDIVLARRTELAKLEGVDVFLSIHHDSVNPKYYREWMVDGGKQIYADDFRGHSIFVSTENVAFEQSLALAKLIGARLRSLDLVPTLHHAEKIPGEDRVLISAELGVYDAPFAVLRTAASPSVLFEVGVLVHREEELLLETTAHRRKMQGALLDALQAYCALKGTKTP